MKVIFLDFDGVINRVCGMFEPELVARLNRITDLTGAVIVVHSSWRWHRTVEQLRDILWNSGVTGVVADKCSDPFGSELTDSGIHVPSLNWKDWKGDISTDHERAIAVQRWLNEHQDCDKYVILDDCDSLGHFVGTEAFIKTDMCIGLTDEHVDKAIHLLNSQLLVNDSKRACPEPLSNLPHHCRCLGCRDL